MRLAALPGFVSLALLVAPAFAQSSGMNGGSAGTSATSQSGQQGVSSDTQQKLRHSLEQNGFKNVQVIPQSFVIRAQAPDGSWVVMEVSPDQFTEVVGPAAGSGNSTSRSGSSRLNDESGSSTSTLNKNPTGNTTGTGQSR